MTGQRLVAAAYGLVYSKQSCSADEWQLFEGINGVTDVAASGQKILAMTETGEVFAKDGDGDWTQEAVAGTAKMIAIGWR